MCQEARRRAVSLAAARLQHAAAAAVETLKSIMGSTRVTG